MPLHVLLTLQVPGASSYFGCVGADDFGKTMAERAKAGGVNVRIYCIRKQGMALHASYMPLPAVALCSSDYALP
jgi:sugar/nucleoside kinase (ribokinase family)